MLQLVELLLHLLQPPVRLLSCLDAQVTLVCGRLQQQRA
jgi:hypothetical protein